MLLRQFVQVGLRGHVSIAKSVLDGGRRGEELGEELLPRLLRDGFGWHDRSGQAGLKGGEDEMETEDLGGSLTKMFWSYYKIYRKLKWEEFKKTIHIWMQELQFIYYYYLF